MPEKVTSYGFSLPKATVLSGIADREITRTRNGGGTEYPRTLNRVYEVVPFINSSGVLIPAYAVMRVTTPVTVDGEMIVGVAKPDATYRWRYLINSGEDIPASSTARGGGTWIFDTDRVLKDPSPTPTYGERWGPTSGQWYLSQHRPGFIVDGRYNATTGVLWAQQAIPGEVRVKNDDGSGTLAAGAGGRTFGIYGGAAGATDTGLKVTLTNGTSVAWLDTKYGMATADTGGLIFLSPQQT